MPARAIWNGNSGTAVEGVDAEVDEATLVVWDCDDAVCELVAEVTGIVGVNVVELVVEAALAGSEKRSTL